MGVFFPSKTIQKMKTLGISESEASDVFHHGEYKTTADGAKMAIKKYNGYEIGLFYTMGNKTGEYVILTVWKRERR